MSGAFDFLKYTNDWLEEYPVNIVHSFGSYFKAGEEYSQDKVDIICRWLAWRVNIMIERRRQDLIKALYGMYQTTVGGKVIQAAYAVRDFVKDPLGAIGSVAGVLFAPFNSIIQWAVMLAKELPRLARNLANIAQALPPEPPNPHINFNEFKLRVKSVDMATITSNPNNLPSPESMFPEPTRPWSREAFATEMNAVDNWKASKGIPFYTPKKEESRSDLRESLENVTNINLPDSI